MTRPDPPYLEAYPRLIDHQVIKAWKCDEELVARFATESDKERGWLRILNVVEGGFVANWKLVGPGLNPDIGQFRILFDYKPSGPRRQAPFGCAACKKRVRQLVYRSFWACASCQGLRNRSTFLSTAMRRQERAMIRIAEITAVIPGGRPPRMRQRTYQALRKEKAEHSAWLERHPLLFPNLDRVTQVAADWMPPHVAQARHGYDPDRLFHLD